MNTTEVKERLRREGRTIKEWADSKGVTDYQTVRALLNGFSRGTRGKSHRIAVQLGLK